MADFDLISAHLKGLAAQLRCAGECLSEGDKKTEIASEIAKIAELILDDATDREES